MNVTSVFGCPNKCFMILFFRKVVTSSKIRFNNPELFVYPVTI